MISNMTVVIGEKDPLELVEAVGQQLEQEDRNQQQEVQGSHFSQDLSITNTALVTELQDIVQDTHLQDTTQPQNALVEDTTVAVTIDTSHL